jgi:hypothetical protein
MDKNSIFVLARRLMERRSETPKKADLSSSPGEGVFFMLWKLMIVDEDRKEWRCFFGEETAGTNATNMKVCPGFELW